MVFYLECQHDSGISSIPIVIYITLPYSDTHKRENVADVIYTDALFILCISFFVAFLNDISYNGVIKWVER